MEYIKINGKTYGYATNVKDDDRIRDSFNRLARKVYGFDFAEWYQNGYWTDKYIPHVLLDGNDVIANVSVNIMDFLDMGEKKRYIQIGTVMTDSIYRNQGLSRFLIERVLEYWREKCDLIYLFANDSVLDFYPKFDFVSTSEYQCSKDIFVGKSYPELKNLNMFDEGDRDFLVDRINDSRLFSRLAMYDNAPLVMFYCTSFMRENVYYIDALDAIVIADFHDNILYLNDVFCSQDISLDDLIAAAASDKINKVILGFTPEDMTSYDVKLLKEEDTTLFIIGEDSAYFSNKKVMFPVLSHA